jgi:hypothetical protein
VRTRARLNLAATGSLLAATAASADFVGVSVVMTQNVGPAAAFDNYQLFANFTDPNDQLLYVAGTGGHTLTLDSGGGGFYQNKFGSDVPPPQFLIDAFPDLEWDSYFTIGTNVSDDGQPPVLSPGFPPAAFNDGSDAVTTTNGGWLLGIPDPETFAGADLQVLIGRFSVASGNTFSGTLGEINTFVGGIEVMHNDVAFSFGPIGACCFGDSCNSDLTESECIGGGGSFQGPGVPCAFVECTFVGACCFGDGTCIETQELACGHSGGSFMGVGVTCLETFCTGACCLGDGTCAEGAPDACLGVDGQYQGNGTACASVDCTFGSVTAFSEIRDGVGGFVGPLDPGDVFGTAVTSPGDLGGDGTVELVVGAPSDDDGGGNDRGAIWVLSLDATGTVVVEQKISATAGGFSGVLEENDQFGSSLAAIGDLDDDGIVDLAVGAPFDIGAGASQRGAVWVVFLNADGTVKAEQEIADAAGGFTGVLDDGDRFGRSVAAIGDLDLDGIEDIAVGAFRDDGPFDDQGAVWILFLNTDGTVKAHQKINATEGGFTGTLDASDEFGSSVSAVGDLDGDGVIDLVAGAWQDDDGSPAPDANRGAVWILFLNTDGTVHAQQKISAAEGGFTGVLDDDDVFGSSATSLGDLDGDGVADLVVGAYQDDDGGTPPAAERGAVWVLFLNADGTVKTHAKISDTAGNLTAALADLDSFGFDMTTLGDLDGDGVTEIAVGAPGRADAGGVFVLFLQGPADEIQFEDPQEAQAAGAPVAEAVGFLDTIDGTIDVAVVIPDVDPALPGNVQVILNLGVDGMGNWLGFDPQLPVIPVGPDPTSIAIDLLNADLYADIAVTNANDGTVTILFNDANDLGTFSTSATIVGFNAPSAVASGDLLGGASADLVVANAGDDTVIVLENNGSGSFTPSGPYDLGANPVAIDVRDLDDDRDLDLVSANFDGDSVTVVLNNGDGTFSPEADTSVGPAPDDLATGDLDGNGYPDIVTANSGDGTVSIVFNNGTFGMGPVPPLEPPIHVLVGIMPESVEVADLDADGDLDIVAVADDPELGPALQILENLIDNGGAGDGAGGGALFGVPDPVPLDNDPDFVVAADLNGDGTADLVTMEQDTEDETAGGVSGLISDPILPCPGDVDGSEEVGFGDILTIIGEWGPCKIPTSCPLDLNGDALVGFGDILVVIANWGPCP